MHTINVQGTAVPALGFGTWKLKGQEAVDAIRTALDVGYRHLDTAEMYDNEAEVGRALRESGVARESVFLTTKVWHEHLKYQPFLDAARKSLDRLNTDSVDLLLVHWPNPEVELEETMDALQEARARGMARLIGVSNFTPSLLERALDIVPDLACNQVEHHVFLGQETLLELVRKHGLVLTSYSPLARGEAAENEIICAIAERHGKSPHQIALRWLLQHDRVAAIPRSSNPAHIRANVEVFDFSLDEDEVEAIDRLPKDRRSVDPDFAPDWER